MKFFAHNALKYKALAMIALVEAGSGPDIISLIFPSVFSVIQLKCEK